MLNENQVIEYLITYLKNKGYDILETCDTSKKGYDIVMTKDGRELYVEAKGETSSKQNTSRFNKSFTHSQKKHHVAMAIFKSLQIKSEKNNCDVAIALPSDTSHRKLINSVYNQLKKLEIKVFFVKNSKEVE